MKKLKQLKQAITTAIMLAASPAAFASQSTGMPWESPLQSITASLQGPVAFAIAVAALAASGAALVFGEDMSGFVRKLLMAVMAIALLVGGAGLMARLFGVSGALVF